MGSTDGHPWRGRAGVLAACLLFVAGVLVGYLLRGSHQPDPRIAQKPSGPNRSTRAPLTRPTAAPSAVPARAASAVLAAVPAASPIASVASSAHLATRSPVVSSPTARSTTVASPVATEPIALPAQTPIAAAEPGAANAPGYLHAVGSKLVDAAGNTVVLTGVNWFGLETCNFAPHGLWAESWQTLLDDVKEFGFNTIRLPYSDQLFDSSSTPNGINFQVNPDLAGLSGPQIMDKIVAGARQRGLRVILDQHRPDCGGQSSLWYTDHYSEDRWLADWRSLVERYKNDPTVIGVDLHNEPHGDATWGSGDPRTDWRLAAERAGNAILAINPRLLILVEGIDHVQNDWYWWGGNLEAAKEYPVRLSHPDQLVYSPHDYGPGVNSQSWFQSKDFPDNLPGLWTREWGYLSEDQTAPVLVGEFGGRSVGNDTEGIWQRALVSFLKAHQISYTYWALNPNSGDTGGLLADDWKTPVTAKLDLLRTFQAPLVR